ncbi:bacterial regulatory helix-turn-helix, lysR family protein [Burkholderia cepacia]|nr:bacterial regulatory helix-turn-helix, lysR family protein [Burkholderia cepacia]
MNAPDLNLLIVLDALLSENSVARAAETLGLSPSALSRSLARLRATTGDPLLVRAGRDLVPTPHALELRVQVRALVEGAQAVLCPCKNADLGGLERTFTIRANEGFVDTFAAELLALVMETAPNVRLRFAPKPDKSVEALRMGPSISRSAWWAIRAPNCVYRRCSATASSASFGPVTRLRGRRSRRSDMHRSAISACRGGGNSAVPSTTCLIRWGCSEPSRRSCPVFPPHCPWRATRI